MKKNNSSDIVKTVQKVKLQSINRVISTLAFVLIVIIGLQYIAQDLIAPLLLAIFIMVLLFPIFRWFRSKGLSSGISVVLMCITFFLGAGALVVFITWSFGLMAQSLSVYVDSFKSSVTQTAESLNVDSTTTETVIQSINPETVASIVQTIFSSFGSFVMYFVIIPLLSILMLIQIDSFPKDMSVSLMKNNSAFSKFPKFAQSIMVYLSGRLKVNIVTGVLFAIALVLLGVDYPFVWGFLTIILSFIPYIGIVIAGIPPTLLAFATSGLPGAILVIGSILLINFFAENVLDPYVQGRGSKISTAAVIIALIFWTWLLGPIGAILSVPLTVFIKIILSEYQETYWISLLMEGNYKKAKEFTSSQTQNEGLRNKISGLFTKK